MLFPLRDRHCFGGSALKRSHAKTSRPLSSKSALHIVMKSKYATGSKNLKNYETVISKTAFKLAKKFGVKIYAINIGPTNIQILLRFSKRKQFQSFLRGFSGLVARKILKAERGQARKYDTAFKKYEGGRLSSNKAPLVVKKGERFWDQRPFTRIVSWGPSFNKTKNILFNSNSPLKAFGFLRPKTVNTFGFEQLYAKILEDLRIDFGFA